MSISVHDVHLVDVYDHAFDSEKKLFQKKELEEEVEEYMLYVADDYLMVLMVNY
jgi:hypothetical protein